MGSRTSRNAVETRKEKKKAESKTLIESGCSELYKEVQNCVNKEAEWINCTPVIHNFRACLAKYHLSKKAINCNQDDTPEEERRELRIIRQNKSY